MENVIHIVMCSNRDYLPSLEAVLTSVRANLNPISQLAVTVLTQDLSRSDIRWTNRSLHDSISCVCPSIELGDVLPVRTNDHVSVETYFRLYMDRVLDKSVQRIIYLDSDLVVLGDLTELAAIELGGRTIGAVKDFLIKRCGNAAPAFRFDLGLASQPYFNAGVMLVDLEKWRRERIRERTLEFLRLNHSSIRWWDQDALNFMIAGDWLELDPRWNRQSAYWWLKGENAITGQDGLLNPHIVHFTGKDKPWRNYRHPDKRVYEHYLCLAGYADHRLSLFKAVALKIAEKLKLKWSF